MDYFKNKADLSNEEYNLKLIGMAFEKELEDNFDDAYSDDKIPEPSEDTLNRIDSIFANKIAKAKNKHNNFIFRKKLTRALVTAAVFLISLIPLGALTVYANKEIVANFLIQNFDKYSVIKYDKNQDAIKPYGWESEYYPTWVPEGFVYDKIKYAKNRETIWYTNDYALNYSFTVSLIENDIEIDSENYNMQELLVSDLTATLYTSLDYTKRCLVININQQIIKISGNLSAEQIIKIGESTKSL